MVQDLLQVCMAEREGDALIKLFEFSGRGIFCVMDNFVGKLCTCYNMRTSQNVSMLVTMIEIPHFFLDLCTYTVDFALLAHICLRVFWPN